MARSHRESMRNMVKDGPRKKFQEELQEAINKMPISEIRARAMKIYRERNPGLGIVHSEQFLHKVSGSFAKKYVGESLKNERDLEKMITEMLKDAPPVPSVYAGCANRGVVDIANNGLCTNNDCKPCRMFDDAMREDLKKRKLL